MNSYEKIFDSRGSAYDCAMRRCPHARRQEFEQLVLRAELQPQQTIADVPAGGGYLKPFIPQGCVWWGHEPCASFTHHGQLSGGPSPLLPLPWSDASVDVALSLAGVHHLEDKRPFFEELHRVVKEGGRFVLSDVEAGSSTAHFLDDYVGQNNSTGHEGSFLDEHVLTVLGESGWGVHSAEAVNFHWTFASLDEMEAFCVGLFDLRKASKGETSRAIQDQLTVDEMPDGKLGMRWSLMTVVSVKNNL